MLKSKKNTKKLKLWEREGERQHEEIKIRPTNEFMSFFCKNTKIPFDKETEKIAEKSDLRNILVV